MEWVGVLIIIVVIASFSTWIRSEASEDRREIFSLIKAIESEIKDFHGRLCALEEKMKNKD